jgi:hypothetical protein
LPPAVRALPGWSLLYACWWRCAWSRWYAPATSVFGRNPWDNLVKTLGDFARPSFLDVWFGPERLEYRSDDGTLLRVENRREVEANFLAAVGAPPG